MKIKLYILTILISMLIWSSLGCTDTETSVKYSVYDLNGTNTIIGLNESLIYETTIAEENDVRKYTGIVVGISFSSVYGQDTILFSDGILINVNEAENHIWKLGKTHVIDVQQEADWEPHKLQVLNVEIID